MSTPLAATARITIKYTVRSFVHRIAMYCAFNIVLGVPQMVDRDGITTVLWTLGAQYAWDKIRATMSTTDTPTAPAAVLESRTGALWNPVAVAALTGVGSFASPMNPAQQTTWVVRDTSFKKIRWVLLETIFSYINHTPTGIDGTPQFDDISKMLDGQDASANAPYRWQKSRGDRFILASGAIAGRTSDLNDKMKRARYLE